MNNIVITSIPKITFAQTYRTKNKKYTLDNVENCMEITFIEKGQYCATRGETFYTFNEGDMICNDFKEKCYVEINNLVEIHTFIIYFSGYTADKQTENSLNIPFQIPKSITTEMCKKILDKIIVEYNVGDKNSYSLLSNIFMILHILREKFLDEKKVFSFKEENYVDTIKKYIYQSLHRKITLPEISSYIDLNSAYVCTIFKKVTGLTLIEYINIKKLERIKDLIFNSNFTLQQAADAVCISDTNYISRMFRKYFNISLSELKKIEYIDIIIR